MGSFSIWHWLVVLVIVILIFGTKKLKTLGSDLGEAIKNFKSGMKEEGEKPAAPAEAAAKSAPVKSEAAPVAEPPRLAHQAAEPVAAVAPAPRVAKAKARSKTKAKVKSKSRRPAGTRSGSA